MIKKYSFLLIAALAIMTACNKDTFHNTDTKVGISRVTFFPTITVKGSDYPLVPIDGAYTDAGATATAGGADVPVKVDGTVNTGVPGVYTLTYVATNSDGFNATGSRRVIVYKTDPDAAAHDLSGNYARTTNGSIAEWTKIAPGVYSVFNPGGAPGTNLTVIVFNSSGYSIKIPQQLANDGTSTTSDLEEYDANTVPVQFKWKIVNPGYGTSVRTFKKQ